LICAGRGRIRRAEAVDGTKSNAWLSPLTYVLPFLIFIGFWIFLMNQVQRGGSKVMSFGKSRAKRLSVDSPKITFRDVAGVDEAVEELHEIKEFRPASRRFNSDRQRPCRSCRLPPAQPRAPVPG
jgi:cell division protease FtsH